MSDTGEQDAIVLGEEAFGHAAGLEDRFVSMLVRQGLVDVLASRRLLPGDLPLHLDLLDHARALTAVYADRAGIAAMARGGASPLTPEDVRARLAAAEAAGAGKRGAEALAHCEALPAGEVRELLRWGLGISAERLAREGARDVPVDLAVQARLFEESFAKTLFVRNTAEGQEPMPFI